MIEAQVHRDASSSDLRAFNSAIQAQLEPAFRVARLILRNEDDAEDAVQEAALKAWEKRAQLRGGSSRLGPWFLAIVVNHCRSVRRNKWWSVLKVAQVNQQSASPEETVVSHADLAAGMTDAPSPDFPARVGAYLQSRGKSDQILGRRWRPEAGTILAMVVAGMLALTVVAVWQGARSVTSRPSPEAANSQETAARSGTIELVAGGGAASPAAEAFPGGAATTSVFRQIAGIAVSPNGDIFVADNRVGASGVGRGGVSQVRKVAAADGLVMAVTSVQHDVGLTGIGLDRDGNLFFAVPVERSIREIAAGSTQVKTVAEGGPPSYGGIVPSELPANAAGLRAPTAIAVDGNGDLLIADTGNHVIRKLILSTGIVKRVAGTGKRGLAGNNGPAVNADLDQPAGIAIDGRGNLFIADTGNNVIRKVDGASGIITTIAGTGRLGYSGDGGPALSAMLSQPKALALDHFGNLFIADYGNNVIRQISASDPKNIWTVVGNGKSPRTSDDARAQLTAMPALQAQLHPNALALDFAGNLIVADDQLVRKVVFRD